LDNLSLRSRRIKRAGWVGVFGNGFLSAGKIAGGFFAGSLALVGDGIDSASDVVTSLVTLFTAGLIDRPPDNKHPYGHARAETVATKILGFLIFFAGAQLALSTLRGLLEGATPELPGKIAAVIAALSILGKILLALYKFRVGRAVNSPMLIADGKNMVGDVVISGAVLLGIALSIFTGIALLDPVMALLVSFWIMKVASSIFLEAGDELMDGLDNPQLYRAVFDAASRVEGVGNPHKTRIRKLGNAFIIDMDIEVDGTLSVSQGHDIARRVEEAIHQSVEHIYDVQVHIEPEGNKEGRERFGLSRESLED
jgi:cation diffusion facilitator family transporter